MLPPLKAALRPLAPLCALLLALSAFAAPELSVRFLDVGQGDAALVTTPAGKTVLIDAGPPEAGARLARRLKELVSKPLDVVVLTHPHLDHLGGMIPAVEAMGALRFLEPEFDHPSTAYLSLLELLGKKGLAKLATGDPARPKELVSYSLDEGVKLWILWPRIGPDGERVEPFLSNSRSDANANSIVAKLVYGKTSFLLAADAEADTEALLVGRPLELGATVLKVAHHGSRHSSTEAFLARVRPKAAVISCGAGNEYGHPSPETLSRLERAGAQVFRTDRDGEIHAQSDGRRVLVSARGAEPIAFAGEGTEAALLEPSDPKPKASAYAASKRSKVFHAAGCSAVATIKRSNLLLFGSREEAARGRTPAGDCRP